MNKVEEKDTSSQSYLHGIKIKIVIIIIPIQLYTLLFFDA